MKLTRFVAAAVIPTLAATFALSASALAHVPAETPACDGLTVTYTSYEGTATNNRVVVTVDGAAATINFGSGYTHRFPWSTTSPHTWAVALDANLHSGNPTQFDHHNSGTQQPCPPSSTTTHPTSPTSTTAPAASTVPPTTQPPATTAPPAPTSSTPETTAPSPTTTPATSPATTPNSTSPAPPPNSTDSTTTTVAAGITSTGTPPLPNDCDANTTTGRGTYSDGQPCGPALILDAYPKARKFVGPVVALPKTGTDLSDVEQHLPATGIGVATELALVAGGLTAGLFLWLVLPRIRRRGRLHPPQPLHPTELP